MPDPTEVSPVALAEKAQLITPDDATYLNGVMDRTGVNVDLVGQDLTQVRRQWDTIEKGKSFSSLTDDPLAAAWLVKAHNAAAVQDDLQSIIGFRDALKGSTLPQPASMFELSGAYISKSWKMASLGAGIVATAPISAVQAALGEETVAGMLTDVGGAIDEQYRAQRADIADRLLSTGGNEYQVLIGDLIGQAPEMVGSGGLAALGAKSLAKPLIKMLGASLLSETKVALTGMSVIEGMQGAAMNLSSRAADNADAGKDPVSMHDVAASLSIGAMTALVARVAGLTGEARLLGGGRVSTWAGVGRDVAIQMGEETSQEVFEQLINDIAGKRFSGWESYKWAALGGAIGGGMFSAPAFIQKMRSMAPPAQRDAAARDIRVLSDIAQAPVATANAHALAQQQAILAQSKAIKRGLSLDDLSQLTGASRTDKQFFDAGDFAKVAEAFSMAPERLIAEWGGKSEGGTVEVNTVAMAYGMRQAKPEQVAAAIEHARKQPDKPSLADIQVRMKEIEAIAAEDDEAALPGGVKDDSDAIAKEVEAEVTAAQVDTKRTKANARADAQLEAARWRSAAIAWNDAYASRGESKRVTPKQLYTQSKAKVLSESDQVLTPEEIDKMLSELGNAVNKQTPTQPQPAAQTAKPPVATGGGWDAIQKLADAYKASATAENLAAVKAAIIAEAKAGTLSAPNGAKVTHVFETGQGSIYVITEDGQTRRVKSEHKNTGDDHGLHDWNKHGIFVTDSNLVQLRADADPNNRKTHAAVSVQDMMGKFGGHGTALNFKDGKARIRIYTDGAWRDAKWSDMFPKSIGTLVQDGVIEFSYSKSPVDGGGILEWDSRADGTLRGVHPGSPVTNGSIVDVPTKTTLAQDDKGTYTPEVRIAKLNASADASTVQHELTHHWLEVLRGWAADPAAPAAFREQLQAIGSWATDKAESIAKHYTATTDKGVSADAIRTAAADMTNLNLNTAAGKAIHEGFTGAYEQYLATGKAPTTALKRVFASFRRWMRDVARSMFSADLLTDDAKAIFDRMLMSHDQVAQPHLQQLTAESLGMSDEQFGLMEDVREDAIRKSQVEIEKILDRRARAYAKQDDAALLENVKSLVNAKPENRARAILAKQRISKAAAHAVIKDPTKQAAIEKFVADAGLDPQEVANSAGYSTEAGSIEMLESLADGKSYDQVLSEAVMEAKTAMPPLTVEDRIEELRVSAEGRALMAAAEGAAMRDAIRLSKAGKAEGVKAGAAEATAQAEVDATAAEAVSEERVNAMKASRDAWQTKAKDAAVRLKATKAAWDVEGARIIAEMEQENAALINDGAAYRLMQKTHKQSDLQQEHDANVKKMAKAVKNRDYRLAINTHLEILTLSKMRSLLAAKTVQDVKADAASRKKDTLDALSAGAVYDAALMAEMAHDKVRRIPATDLREGVWGKRADAARRRREKAVAQQNIPAILKSTNEIMWAETMEAEVLRTLAEKDAIATGVANSLSATERVKLVYAGAPTIVYYEGDVVVKTETFPTWTAAEQRHANIRGYAIGAVLTRGGELSNVRDAIGALMSRKRRNDGIAALQAIVDGKVAGITYMTARMKGLVDEHINAQPQPAGGGRLNPDLWTLHDWETVMEQMETLQSAAAIVPRQREEQEAVLHEMFNAVDIKAKPPTQRSKMSGPIRALSGFSSSGLNIRSLGVKLGSAFEKHIMQPLLAAEAEGFALRRRIGKMVQGHIDGITGPLRKQMDQRYDSYGVKTDGWERISRLLMLGTRTGRDRVVNDLKLRGCTDVSSFLQDMSKGLSQQEVDLIGAWWKANEEIWRFQQASAVRTGQTPPKSLEATPFDVLVDGKPMRLAGGYAAVPYEISKSAPRIMDDDGRMVMAFFDDGFMNERVEKVDSKLDLSIEAQFNSQISKIRTAALKPHAFNVSAILTDARFREQSITHYGEDWYKALVSDVKFAFNGDANAKDALNSAASYVRRAFTFSVYWMNMKTAISQFSGIVNSAAHPDIGFRALLGSMGNALHGPKAFSERIAQSSYVTLMRTHAQDADYMSPDEVTQSARTYEKWLSAGTWAMRKAQWIVDTVTWDAAYQKAKANLRNKVTDAVELEYRAVAIANRALHETQGSAMRAEQSAISHSEIGRLVTFGGKWMLNYGNYLRRQMHAAFAEMKVGDSWEARKAFAKSVLVGLVMNAMAYQAVRALVSPEKDDDEQRDLTDYAWAVGTDVAGTPNHVIRMFAIPAFEAFVSNTKTLQQQRGGLIQLSGERSMEDAVSLFKNFGYILRDEDKGDSPQRMIGQAVSAGSIILPGLPGTMTKRLMDADFDQGYEAWVAAVFGWDKTPIRQDAN